MVCKTITIFLRKDDLDTKSLVILASGTLHKAFEHLAPRLQGYVEARPKLLPRINRIEDLNNQMWEGVLKGIPKLNTKKSQKRQ